MRGLGRFDEERRLRQRLTNHAMKTSTRIYLGGLLAAALIGLLLFWFRPSARMPNKPASSETPVHAATAPAKHQAHMPRAAALPARAPAKHFPVAADGTVAVPARYQLPGVSRVRTAANFNDWLKQYPAADRDRIKAFDTRYNGVYEISSPQQIAWMAQNGYPMPDDLIAAQGIDDQTLRDLADHGNDKAGFLYHDRYLERLGDRHETQLDLSNPSDLELANALDADHDIFLATPSPFKGYVEAADAFRVYADPMAQKARLISGLLRASQLGDSRADYILNEYVDSSMVSDQEYVIATQILIDAHWDQSFIPGANCPKFSNLGPIPMQ
ncbi:MAG: hypothetical protein ACREPN_02725 [Rudaea sp.]